MSYPPDAGDLTLLRSSPQSIELFVAGLEMPTVVFACQINQAFASLDMIGQFNYDNVTTGAFADVLPGMTAWIGSAPGLYDLGEVRVRKALTSSIFYIGETSEIPFDDDLYVTVVDEMAPWAKHIKLDGTTPLMDYEVAYSDQHTDFDPTPIMGPPVVLDVAAYPVAVTFPEATKSFVYDASISAWLWTATAGSLTGQTTNNPTLTINSYPTNGRIRVALLLTSSTGKQFTGYRYVYIYDSTHRPPEALYLPSSPEVDYNSGGWSCVVSARANASLTSVRDRSPVILFAKDRYGTSSQSLGPLAGRENIVMVGWVVGESIEWSPTASVVTFEVKGLQHWLAESGAFPHGIEFAVDASSAWTNVYQLTVDKALWTLLHWRTTTTAITDIKLTDDTRLTLKAKSLADSLWAQMTEIASLQLLALPGTDRYQRLFIEIDPQLVVPASRTWPSVMTITKNDYSAIRFTRRVVPAVSQVDLSGVAINSSGGAEAFFSLSPGRVPKRFGKPLVMDRLLLSTQADSNTLASLLLDQKNNRLQLEVDFTENNRYFDCFPRQRAYIEIAAEDTVRGIAYTGYLVPRRVQLRYEESLSALVTTVFFEIDTVEGIATNGDIPGSEEGSYNLPPLDPLPALPLSFTTFPGLPSSALDAPRKVLVWDPTKGLIYTENFETSSPSWRTINAGLIPGHYQNINVIEVCPNGAIYVGFINKNSYSDTFLFRAPSAGATFVQQTIPDQLVALSVNPLVSEQIAIITNASHGGTATFRLGANNSFAAGATFADLFPVPNRLSYGLNQWLLTTYDSYRRFNAAGTSIVASGSPSINRQHIRAGTTGITFHNQQLTDNVRRGDDNLASITTVSTGENILIEQGDETLPITRAHVDDTGMFLMAPDGTGAGASSKSTDGGATWIDTGLEPGFWAFRNAGHKDRWIAGWGTVDYTKNFGTSWEPKHGTLTGIAVTFNIKIIRVVGY